MQRRIILIEINLYKYIFYNKKLDKIPKRVYNEYRIKERRKAMNTILNLLEITKDLLEILVLVLTAWQLTKNNKDN